jgi:hypothetical protein
MAQYFRVGFHLNAVWEIEGLVKEMLKELKEKVMVEASECVDDSEMG